MPSPCGTEASVFAHIGPEVGGDVMQSGHTGVVAVTGLDWSSDPFTVTERSGRLYGRGTCDTKGLVALAQAAVPLMMKSPLKRPIQIALSTDEVTGMTGAPPMIDRILASGLPKAEAVIVGEPSMMQAISGHKGGTAHNITARDCRFEIDFRVVPGEDQHQWEARFEGDAARLEAQMKAVHPAAGITLFQDFSAPGLAPSRSLSPAPHWRQYAPRCQLRHRRQAAPAAGIFHSNLRPRRYRPGVSAG